MANSGNRWLKIYVTFYYTMKGFLTLSDTDYPLASERVSPPLHGLSKPESGATVRVTEMTCQRRSAARWAAGEMSHRWAALQKQLSRASCGLSENELAGLDRLAPKMQERTSASDTPVRSEDIASALALGGWAAGCVEAMGKLSGDGGCQAKYTQAVSRWDSLSKNYSSVNN